MASSHAASLPLVQQAASFLGVRIDLITPDELIRFIESTVRSESQAVIAHHNSHSLCLFHQNIPGSKQFHDFYRHAQLTLADGMSTVALGRLHGQPISREHRIAYNDWLPVILRTAVRNHWRVLYLGSQPQVASIGEQKLRAQYQGLELVLHHGHFDTAPGGKENQEVLESIRTFQPHLLFVGMGMPRQECWIDQNIQSISANVILTSGATLDYIAGCKRMAPRWMGRIGLEWAFRLATEPTRLAHRYLVEPWGLLRVILANKRASKIEPPVASSDCTDTSTPHSKVA